MGKSQCKYRAVVYDVFTEERLLQSYKSVFY